MRIRLGIPFFLFLSFFFFSPFSSAQDSLLLFQSYAQAIQQWTQQPSIHDRADLAQDIQLLQQSLIPLMDPAQKKSPSLPTYQTFLAHYIRLLEKIYPPSHPSYSLVTAAKAYQTQLKNPGGQALRTYGSLALAYTQTMRKQSLVNIEKICTDLSTDEMDSPKAPEVPEIYDELAESYQLFLHDSYNVALPATPPASQEREEVSRLLDQVTHPESFHPPRPSHPCPPSFSRCYLQKEAPSPPAKTKEPPPPSFSDDSDYVEVSLPESDGSSLVDYKTVQVKNEKGQTELKKELFLSPVLEKIYPELIAASAVSYDFAELHSHANITAEEKAVMKNRHTRVSKYLAKNAEKGVETVLFYGATGAENQDTDATGVITYDPRSHVITVAFHGSRNGSKNPFTSDGRGDWGSNFSSKQTPAGKIGTEDKKHPWPQPRGIQHMDPQVVLQGGFGNNFWSAQASMNEQIDRILSRIPPQDLSKTWIITTGHSKGGGLASIAAPTIKNRMQSFSKYRGKVKVGAVLFSAPRAFVGDHSQKWVHDTLGQNNMIHVGVVGDPVPIANFYAYGFRDTGIWIQDTHRAIEVRHNRKYNKGLGILDHLAVYHYGSSRQDGTPSFDPELVIPFNRLERKLRRDEEENKELPTTQLLNERYQEKIQMRSVPSIDLQRRSARPRKAVRRKLSPLLNSPFLQ